MVDANYEQRLSASSFANKMAQPNYSCAFLCVYVCVCVCNTWHQVVQEKNSIDQSGGEGFDGGGSNGKRPRELPLGTLFSPSMILTAAAACKFTPHLQHQTH